MKRKISKLSNEELELKLNRLEKGKKIFSSSILFFLITIILEFLFNNKIYFLNFWFIALGLFERYYGIPNKMKSIRKEIYAIKH